MSAIAQEPTPLDDLLKGFSPWVGERLPLDIDQPTAWEMAAALMQDDSDYGPSPLSQPSGLVGRRPRAQWLALVRGMFDMEIVAQSSKEIDARMLILAMGRLDDEFEQDLRRTGYRWKLEGDAVAELMSSALLPWARHGPPTQFLELGAVTHGPIVRDCAFNADGTLLATASHDGTARIWDVATNEPLVLSGHRGRIRRCAFSPDGRLLATASDDGTTRLWNVESGRELAVLGPAEGVRMCAFGPGGTLLVSAHEEGVVRLWDVASANEIATLKGHAGRVRHCAFSPDGRLLASAGDDGTARLWDVATASERLTLGGHQGIVWHCTFSPDGRLLATVGDDGILLLVETVDGVQRPTMTGHRGAIRSCAFSPDCRLLATAGQDGTARLWDVESGRERLMLGPFRGGVRRCVFSPSGRLIATAGDDARAQLWDVASGTERAALEGHEGRLRQCTFSQDGQLFATASDDGSARIWEEIQPPSHLPALSRDSGDLDWLGIGPDAAALADLIAAKETAPPLSIGLFGDWGSGKSFLIQAVQRRINLIARRAQRSETSAYCAHVRNIVFNAWHYADANLWASLVTHIFDELAKPEPTTGIDDLATAREQVARLQEELAEKSTLREQLVREQQRLREVEARKRLARLTWRLSGAKDDQSLDDVENDLKSIRGAIRLLLPTTGARLALLAVALAFAGAVLAIIAVLGVGQVARSLTAAAAVIATVLVWVEGGRRYAMRLLKQAGRAAKVVDVQSTALDAEVEAAREAERRTATELADLKSGRRLARFAAEREQAADYRAHLGLVSRIHDDFVQMSEILTTQGTQARTAAESAPSEPQDGATADAQLPRIDRIVLYIDDLDRCPPGRVVEVLEAVHLILAVPLFVVVIAVDPRWLLQSLQLHYAELLAGTRTRANDAGQIDVLAAQGEEDILDPSTPINYLEKIIQVPFALRPMAPAGVRSLVHGLLPVDVAIVAPHRVRDAAAGDATAATTASGVSAPATVPTSPARSAVSIAPVPRAPSLSPRTLAITEPEREFAVAVATPLRTPRTVKKFTNLYRLLRAGLDDHSGQLDRFLADTRDAAEYQAVLILLALIIAYPEEASDVLISLGDLAPDAGVDSRPWSEFIHSVHTRGESFVEVGRFLTHATAAAGNTSFWTREPFRRWALEVSRYSFATGQAVFSSSARHRQPA